VLNERQKLLVEENHNLIYDHINRRGLDVQEWYGLLAIVLCECVIKWDESRGNLSTLYYVMADNMMKNEWKKNSRQKRDSGGEVASLDEMLELVPSQSVDDIQYECDWESEIERNVVKLKLAGYTQVEIAKEIGKTQPTVSGIIRRFKERVGGQ